MKLKMNVVKELETVTYKSRNNLNNDGNKGKYRVQAWYFCNEEGYKKYNCPKFNHFEYLKYQKMLNEESSGSANVSNERLNY